MHKSNLALEHVIFTAALLAVLVGLWQPTDRYLSPQSGVGYALGITGGSMMLLLTVYPLRKRIRALRFLGGVPEWFRAHMILGVLGPVCILFHANFSLGATNSNVALFCMLVVSGSGIVGRYLYSKIHRGLYGRRINLAEFQAQGQGLQRDDSLGLLPEMVGCIEREERRVLSWGASPVGLLLTPAALALLLLGARWRVRRHITRAIDSAARTSPVIAQQRVRLSRVAYSYAERRLQLSRQVAAFRMYEGLFSLWHVLHLPLFFMLVIAGITHVIAVNIY
jgi:hypothetical protein